MGVNLAGADMQIAKDVIAGRTKLTVEEIQKLIAGVTNLYAEKPNIVETPSQNTIYVGDLHGNLMSTQAIRDTFLKSPEYSLVFLGDYADRGMNQIETFNLVISMAIQHPKRVLMLRGNHESKMVARMYGFYDVVKSQYSTKLFDNYCEVFKALPLAGLSSSGVFCCHGGVPEGVRSREQILSIDRHSIDLENPIAFQLVWNDPVEADFHFGSNMRGGGTRTFGRLAFSEFVKNLGIRLMIRAHEVFQNGYKRFFEGKLISVFSTPYNGRVSPKVIRLQDDLIAEAVPI
ncbi:MAG: metallophosphoesterase [Candidatus Thorarchaeota archaeon]